MRNMIKYYFIFSQLQNQYQRETLNAQSVVKLDFLVYLNYFASCLFFSFFKKTILPKIEALFVEILFIFLGLSLFV